MQISNDISAKESEQLSSIKIMLIVCQVDLTVLRQNDVHGLDRLTLSLSFRHECAELLNDIVVGDDIQGELREFWVPRKTSQKQCGIRLQNETFISTPSRSETSYSKLNELEPFLYSFPFLLFLQTRF